MVSVNALGTLFFWAMRQEMKSVKELLTVKVDMLEKRLDRVEEKCVECPVR
jgi:hypothetical protein